jgi:diacylglycerol kinase (ATP)
METASHYGEKKRFSIVGRMKAFTHAFRGLSILLRTGHAFWIQILCVCVVAVLGFLLHISSTEWLFVILTCGQVLVAEAVNTAIEIDIDLTSPEYHPYARDTKDVASGAVLLTGFVAIAVALVIFLPKIIYLLK